MLGVKRPFEDVADHTVIERRYNQASLLDLPRDAFNVILGFLDMPSRGRATMLTRDNALEWRDTLCSEYWLEPVPDAGLQEEKEAPTPSPVPAHVFYGFAGRCSQSMRVLSLHGAVGLSDDILVGIVRQLPLLRVLSLTDCTDVSDCGVRAAAEHMHDLRWLSLNGVYRITAASVASVLAMCPQLQHISTRGCHRITNNDLREALLRNGPDVMSSLLSVDFSGCHDIGDDSVHTLAALAPNLRSFDLGYCHKMSPAGVVHLAQIAQNLRHIGLRYCWRIDDTAVKAIADLLPELEELDLSQCGRLTDSGVAAISSKLFHLRALRLRGCTRLSSASIGAAFANLPNLVLFDVRAKNPFAVLGGEDTEIIMSTYRDKLQLWGTNAAVYRKGSSKQ